MFSLLMLLGMIPASLGLVVVKYVSAAKEKSEIAILVKWMNKRIFLIGFIMFIAIASASPLIASFMNIPNPFLIILIGSIFIFSLPATFNRAIMQGLLLFKRMVLTILVETVGKLILGVGLVYIGLSVGGAITGLLMAVFLGWFLTYTYTKKYYTATKDKIPMLKPLFWYSIPVLVQSIAITSLYSSDVVLVKHFFSPHDAGIYAALATIGRIIFFGAGPIGAVMFPLVSQRQARGDNYERVFFYSLMLTLLLALGVLLIYWLFPELTISILSGQRYLEAADLLVWFGIFMTLFTLSALIVNYHLSLGRFQVVLLPAIAALFQIVGILTFHQTLMSVIFVSILISCLLLMTLVTFSAIYRLAQNSSN